MDVKLGTACATGHREFFTVLFLFAVMKLLFFQILARFGRSFPFWKGFMFRNG